MYFRVSIRSPHRSEGRFIGSIAGSEQRRMSWNVSIRSPHRSEGRSISNRISAHFGICSQPVSIRSPHRSEGRYSSMLHYLRKPEPGRNFVPCSLPLPVSIRSPHRSEGRCLVRPTANDGNNVSIRSPHRSEGRQGWQWPDSPSFNPLPPPE